MVVHEAGVEEAAQDEERPTAVPDRHRRRRWPWILGAVVALLGALAVVFVVTTNHAHEVTMSQAEARLGPVGGSAGNGRPAPGVYRYVGSGTEHLSLPPLSQSEGPVVPGTVTWQGRTCWTFRLDYSTHHWQTWNYCLHHGSLWEAGGVTWQLWSIGPIDVTNTSTFVCAPGTEAVPAGGRPGERWQSSCRGTNSFVKGVTISAGPYVFQGYTDLRVDGTSVRAAHFLRLRTDTGTQKGTERSEVWFDTLTGLPLRLDQNLRVRTSTPFGESTYTQSGSLSLTSLVPRR